MMFAPYLHRWNLVAEGKPFHTFSSDLLPVRCGDTLAMLKIAREAEEKTGSSLMVWWNSEGAARVLAHDDLTGALLLERATGSRALAEMAQQGQDDAAARILCHCLDTLHAPRERPLPHLVPLTLWFHDLAPAAEKHGSVFARSWEVAQFLLADPQDEVVLHGDVHHGNFLDFGPERGWLAIDPKGLWGERGFDYANVFFNPDTTSATAPGRLARQADVIARAAHLDRKRLLQWVFAYAGLSASWTLSGGGDPSPTLAVAQLAALELEEFD